MSRLAAIVWLGGITLLGTSYLVRLTYAAESGESAAAEDLWSLAPVVKPALPTVQRADWCTTPVDRFILARLEADQFEPAPPLARERLVRPRLFRSVGSSAGAEEVRAYLADDSPEAYERLVDRLLASPHFGERWARYWLDVVRFAETNGYERDAEKPGAWRYRDWVIRAINSDMPYDRFALEQLAGDELPDATDETRVATGLLRVGTFDDEPNDPLVYKYEQLDDLVAATSTSFLALTVKCARCHDHKFDPIKQTDYYALLNFFFPGKAAESKTLLAFTDSGRDAPPVKLLGGGDPRREGDIVPAAFLSALPRLNRPIDPSPEGAATTHRRTQLARWITDPANPLAPRVAVNRLWLHHFGEGLCRTPDNFGVMGTAPDASRVAGLAGRGFRRARLARQAAAQDDPHVERVSHGLDSPARRGVRHARFCQRALVSGESSPARSRAAARRHARSQWLDEFASRRRQLLSHRQPRSAGRVIEEGGRVEGIFARGSAAPQHLYVHQAVAPFAADDGV